MVGDDFHGEMSFAIGGAAPDRSADAGSVFGIDPVHIERDVIAGGAATGHAQRLLHDGAHSAFVDIAHRENLDPGSADVFFFEIVDIADTNEHAILRVNLWRKLVNVAEFGGTESHERGEWHAVDIAAR